MSGELDSGERNVVDKVDHFGRTVMRVSSRVEDPIRCCFAYTVGLAVTFGWPELICYGLYFGTPECDVDVRKAPTPVSMTD